MTLTNRNLSRARRKGLRAVLMGSATRSTKMIATRLHATSMEAVSKRPWRAGILSPMIVLVLASLASPFPYPQKATAQITRRP